MNLWNDETFGSIAVKENFNYIQTKLWIITTTGNDFIYVEKILVKRMGFKPLFLSCRDVGHILSFLGNV